MRDITQAGTRFEVLPNPEDIAVGARGIVVEGLHYDTEGFFGISVDIEGYPYPRPKDRYKHWMVTIKNLKYLRPLGDEDPEYMKREIETTI